MNIGRIMDEEYMPLSNKLVKESSTSAADAESCRKQSTRTTAVAEYMCTNCENVESAAADDIYIHTLLKEDDFIDFQSDPSTCLCCRTTVGQMSDASSPKKTVVACACLKVDAKKCESCNSMRLMSVVSSDAPARGPPPEDAVLESGSPGRLPPACAVCLLKADIDDMKRKLHNFRFRNEKLQKQLLHCRQEMCMKDCFQSLTKSHLYKPGLITDLVSEIYSSQRERDEASMARIHLANDERDEALQQLHDVRYKYHQLLSGSSDMDDTNLEYIKDIKPYLNNTEDIVKVKKLLMSRLAKANHDGNLPAFSNDSTSGSLFFTPEKEQSNGIGEEMKVLKACYSLQQCLTPHRSRNYMSEMMFLKSRLLEEMEARQKAEDNCQRLERLVSVLRRKVNGLSLSQRTLAIHQEVLTPPESPLHHRAYTPPPQTSPLIEEDNNEEDLTTLPVDQQQISFGSQSTSTC